MADLPESATYPAGIYQLEQSDPVVGGPPNLTTGEGMSNVQAQQLADRTKWLKTELESRTAPAAILAGLKTVDGSGSGLDADLLDGRNLDQAATNLTVAQRSASGDLSARLFRSEFASESSISSGATIAMRVNASTDNYLRSITAAGFVAWLNANNSGLNADTVDGLQAAQFLRSDQTGSIAGDLTVEGGDVIVKGSSATAGPILWLRDDTGRNRGLLYWDYVRDEIELRRYAANGTTIEGVIEIGSDGTVKVNGGTAWHSGNDGAGSTLDADLLDGLQGSQLLRKDQSDTMAGSLTANAAVVNYSHGIVAAQDFPDGLTYAAGDPGAGFPVNFTTSLSVKQSAHRHFEIAANKNSHSLFFRSVNDPTIAAGWGDWQTVWHSGNDGAGSTLDADLLDGFQGADYARFGTTTGNRDDYLAVNRSGANPALYVNNYSNGSIARFLSGAAKGDTSAAGASLDITSGGGISASGTITTAGKVVTGNDIEVGGNQIIFTNAGAGYVQSSAGTDLYLRSGTDTFAYGDISDTSFRVSMDYRLEGKSKQAVDLGGFNLINVGAVLFNGSTAGDYISYSTGQGLQVFENGVFKARIGPNSYFAETVDMNGGLTVAGGATVENNITTSNGWYYQQGQRMCSQRADYGITATVFARKSDGGETLYGQTLPGSSLQVCNALGGNNNANIGVGTWRCLGYSAAVGAGSEASATLWTRIA